MTGGHLHEQRSDVGVLCCTEAGRLERMSVLLCETIRLRAGRYADVPIYSFQPRPGPALAARTRRRFAELGVVHIEAPLNSCLPHYGYANKAHAAAYAEAFLPHATLVMMDSDMLVLSEPHEFALAEGVDVALRPEPYKVAGTTGDDENDAMWKGFEAHFGLTGPRRFVTTSVSRERIRAYYNSGLLVVRRSAGLFRAWHDCTERLATARLVPQDSRAVFTEQYGLVMAIEQLGLEPKLLPITYNYGLPWHASIPEDDRAKTLDDVAVGHYHDILNAPTAGDPLARVEGMVLRPRDDEIRALIRSSGVTPHPWRDPVRSARLTARSNAVRLAKRLGIRRDYGAMIGPGS